MNLNDQKLSKFKHDVADLLVAVLKIQKETDAICQKAKALLEEFFEIIDTSEE